MARVEYDKMFAFLALCSMLIFLQLKDKYVTYFGHNKQISKKVIKKYTYTLLTSSPIAPRPCNSGLQY